MKKHILTIHLTYNATTAYLVHHNGQILSEKRQVLSIKKDATLGHYYDPLEIIYSVQVLLMNCFKALSFLLRMSVHCLS